MNDYKANIIVGLILAIGLIGAGYQVSNTVYKGKLATNIVTVRGFSERDVKSDLALWTIHFSVSGNDLPSAYDKASNNETIISDFLVKAGLSKDSIKVGTMHVTDMANQYHEKDSVAPAGRYVIQNSLSIRSNDVDMVDKATHSLGELVKQGVMLTGNSVNYTFSHLNDIKPKMLREATQNAKHAADEFAKDSASRVGSIQSANQGFFSITSSDDNSPEGQRTYASVSSLDKKVRVVTTVTYYLEK